MSTIAPHPVSPATGIPATRTKAPILLLFAEYTSGQSRRMDGFVAHVLQRRHNHGSFRYRIVLREQRPDLFERFRVEEVPTLVVIDDGEVKARLTGYHRPSAVEDLLTPWLH
ncbi:MAG: thioredoxin family protein [Thermoleophilia bacterium]|nr:thioredoxin family protein [Thermoleophilia bacterium]